MTRSLHARKHEAVAAGFGTSPSALKVLADWADRIIIMSGEFQVYKLLNNQDGKTIIFPIGPDKWSNPYHPELKALCDQFIVDNPWVVE